jgi:uncharacterized membrane protein YccC
LEEELSLGQLVKLKTKQLRFLRLEAANLEQSDDLKTRLLRFLQLEVHLRTSRPLFQQWEATSPLNQADEDELVRTQNLLLQVGELLEAQIHSQVFQSHKFHLEEASL